MDEREIELTLEKLSRWLENIPPIRPYTPHCPPMAVLVEMAEDPEAGTPIEQSHVRSCRFCGSMIERARRRTAEEPGTEKEPEPVWPGKRSERANRSQAEQSRHRRVVARLLIPVAMAACLAFGLALGSVARSDQHSTALINQAWQVQHELAELARLDKASDAPAGSPGDQPAVAERASEDHPREEALRQAVNDLADRLGEVLAELQQ